MNEFRLAQSGSDIVLYVDASTKRVITGDSGGYTAPDDLSATLVKSGSGSSEIYTLTFVDTGVELIRGGRGEGLIEEIPRGPDPSLVAPPKLFRQIVYRCFRRSAGRPSPRRDHRATNEPEVSCLRAR